MTRRSSKSGVAHGHRAPSGAGGPDASAKEKEVLMRKHRFLRRATGFMLARKYRYIQSMMHGAATTTTTTTTSTTTTTTTTISASISTTTAFAQAGGLGAGASSMWMNVRNTWHDGDHGRDLLSARAERVPPTNGSSSSRVSECALRASRGFSRDELINFWKELPVVAKRRLLRIRREVYLSALDEFLVRQNLCCECHDNVVAEWEDHERRRSGTRSLQDVFSVFPPFLDDDEDDDEDDEEDEDDEDDDDEEDDDDVGDVVDDDDDELRADSEDEVVLAEEELVFKYELERDELRRATNKKHALSDEYLAALEVGKRQEDELLRLIQKEERYIIIREDHTDFIMDLIRCGEQFSYALPFGSGGAGGDLDDDDASDDDVDVDDDSECPGANTSHLAQEYLLEVLAIKFREQLEDAYQEALQHSLAVQAELLREEIADLQACQKPPAAAGSSSKKKKNKEKKKRKKKEAAAAAKENLKTQQKLQQQRQQQQQQAKKKPSGPPVSKAVKHPLEEAEPATRALEDFESELTGSPDALDSPQDEIDREVEEFRILLEQINANCNMRKRKKLVLPPGAFASLTSVGTMC